MKELKGLLVAVGIAVVVIIILVFVRSATTPESGIEHSGVSHEEGTGQPPAGTSSPGSDKKSSTKRVVQQKPKLLEAIIQGGDSSEMVDHLRRIRESSQ